MGYSNSAKNTPLHVVFFFNPQRTMEGGGELIQPPEVFSEFEKGIYSVLLKLSVAVHLSPTKFDVSLRHLTMPWEPHFDRQVKPIFFSF